VAESGVRVEGLREVVRGLQRAGVDIADLKETFSSIAREGARLASGFAPKRSGRLAGSVRGNKAKNKAVVIAGRARIPYAGPINYGWRKRNINPSQFMQRADADLAPRVVEMLEVGLDEAIRRAGLDE